MPDTVYALFDTPGEVRNAISGLRALGADLSSITVTASDPEVETTLLDPDTTAAASPMPGATVGAAAGSVAGVALSVVPAALAGPVLGPVFLLFGFGGAMVGAIAGSVAGAILGSGYEIQHQEAAELAVSSGKILVTVAATSSTAEAFAAELARAGGVLPTPQ
jgi:hypothetical protein